MNSPWLNKEADGVTITGIPVTDHLFMTSIDLSTLCQLTIDPMHVERNYTKSGALNPEDQEAAELRAEFQRGFTGVKKKNVGDYANYIRRTQLDGVNGYVPPINLVSIRPLEYSAWVAEDGHSLGLRLRVPCQFFVPSTLKLFPFDGETQVAAWFQIRREDQIQQPHAIACMVAHGVDIEWAKQAFHDVNHLGHHVSVKHAIVTDGNDPVIRMAREIAAFRPLYGRVELSPRTPKGDKITSLSSFYYAVRAFLGGIQAADRKGPISADLIATERATCLNWFRDVAETCASAFMSTDDNVIGSQCVLVGLGALGHQVCLKEPERRDSALRSLSQVRWAKGPQWLGIALSQSKAKTAAGQDKYSLPNTHQTWKQTFEALARPESALYTRIRTPGAAAA
jgi:hypothetical protein